MGPSSRPRGTVQRLKPRRQGHTDRGEGSFPCRTRRVGAQGISQTVEFRLERIHLLNVGMKVVALDTHVTDAQNQIRGQLFLNLEAPVLRHPGPAIAWGHVANVFAIQESRVGAVLRRRKGRKAGR